MNETPTILPADGKTVVLSRGSFSSSIAMFSRRSHFVKVVLLIVFIYGIYLLIILPFRMTKLLGREEEQRADAMHHIHRHHHDHRLEDILRIRRQFLKHKHLRDNETAEPVKPIDSPLMFKKKESAEKEEENVVH